MSGSVLYDVPGPRARRRAQIGSVVALVVVLLLAAEAVRRLAARDQLDPDLWNPLFNPTDENFPAVWELLLRALLRTLQAAVVAMVASLVLGTLITTARLLLGRTGRIPLVGLVEVLRGVPVVLAIFYAYLVLPAVGIDLSSFWYLVIGLVAYNSVVLAEILRAGVASLPRGQAEAGAAIGLTRWQVIRLVQLPQAFRVMLPAIISQLVVVVKDTSLAAFIGNYEELLRTGNLIIQNLGNPIQTYLLVAAIFIVLNSLLSKAAVWTEKTVSRARTGSDEEEAEGASELATGA